MTRADIHILQGGYRIILWTDDLKKVMQVIDCEEVKIQEMNEDGQAIYRRHLDSCGLPHLPIPMTGELVIFNRGPATHDDMLVADHVQGVRY